MTARVTNHVPCNVAGPFAVAFMLALLSSIAALQPAQAQSENGDEPSATSLSHRMAQGRFFLEAGLSRQAMAEFRDAAAMPDGARDPEVHGLLARSCFLVGDVACAVDAARTAYALSGSDPEPKLAELHEFLTTRFGKVLIIGAAVDRSYRPSPASPILDPELKRVFEAALSRLDGSNPGSSSSVYLPVGTYQVGEHLVEVQAVGTARMDLRPTVGGSGGGLYGERRRGGRTAPADGPATKPNRARGQPEASAPKPAPTRSGDGAGPASAFVLQIGGHGYSQQGSATGGGRLLVGWEGSPGARRFGLRIAGSLDVSRLERLQAATPAPPGASVQVQLGGGGLIPLPAGLALAPWLTWQFGYGRPAEGGLPDAYLGPLQYFVHGPDLELRVRLRPAALGPDTVLVPEVTARMLVREARPLDALLEIDSRPHLSIGGGLAVGFAVGR